MAWAEQRQSRRVHRTPDGETYVCLFKGLTADTMPHDGQIITDVVAAAPSLTNVNYTPAEPEIVDVQKVRRTENYQYIQVVFSHDRVWAIWA